MDTRAVRHQPRTPTLQPTQSRARKGPQDPTTPIGKRAERIEGRFRRVSVHQLTLAWWLYAEGHITRRQYRLYFAAHELAERRRYTSSEHKDRRPLYTVEECAALVGGRGSVYAARELRTDINRLARIGLVEIRRHVIVFAESAEQIELDIVAGERAGECSTNLAGFWEMLAAMPNNRRSVPVPRRLLRAIAAGFPKGVLALITAVLIRGLYWHKETDDYRTDGRYKLSWVSKHFGISRRTATEARAALIGLGWLEPLPVRQWEMNRWGLRDRIVPDWAHPAGRTSQDLTGEPAGQGARDQDADDEAGSASPEDQSAAVSATPDQTDPLPLSGNQRKTRRLRHTRNRSGVSPSSTRGGRHAGRGDNNPHRTRPPNLRDIRPADLRDAERLLELHRQACELGLATSSEAGRLDFMALAQRARSRGRRGGALFFWLLRERKHAFITQHDEDQAARMLREHSEGPNRDAAMDHRRRGRGLSEARGSNSLANEAMDRGSSPLSPEELESGAVYTDDERFVLVCLRVARSHRLDPQRLAQEARGWSPEQWEEAAASYEVKQRDQQRLVCLSDDSAADLTDDEQRLRRCRRRARPS